MRSRARHPPVPCPALRPRRPSATRRSWSPAVRRHRRRPSSERLLARHPANVVRLDLPREEPGDEPDDRYRRAARTLAAWRSDGTLHKDPRPSIYVYEQAYRVPGTDVERTQRGFFARLRLEPFGAGCERAAARADAGRPARGPLQAAPGDRRQHAARSSGCTTDAAGVGGTVLDALTARRADLDVVDDDGVRHRLWAVAGGRRRRAPAVGAAARPRRPRARSRSPTATTATRRPSATATSGGCPGRARRIRPSTTS